MYTYRARTLGNCQAINCQPRSGSRHAKPMSEAKEILNSVALFPDVFLYKYQYSTVHFQSLRPSLVITWVIET